MSDREAGTNGENAAVHLHTTECDPARSKYLGTALNIGCPTQRAEKAVYCPLCSTPMEPYGGEPDPVCTYCGFQGPNHDKRMESVHAAISVADLMRAKGWTDSMIGAAMDAKGAVQVCACCGGTEPCLNEMNDGEPCACKASASGSSAGEDA